MRLSETGAWLLLLALIWGFLHLVKIAASWESNGSPAWWHRWTAFMDRHLGPGPQD